MGGELMGLEKIICTLGRFDIPIIQMQPDFKVDLLDTNIIVYGAAMSGKTHLLKNLINILHKQLDETKERIFILDFGGALSVCRDMPLVAAYFDNSNEEYVKRVFKIMDGILRENNKILGGKNYREQQEQPVHTTFIIDNVNAFQDEMRYSAYQDKLRALCRDGLSKGITVVLSAGDTKGMNAYAGGFKQKIALGMSQEKCAEIFNAKVDQIGTNPGRGFTTVTIKPEGVTGTFRMNLPYEVQLCGAEPVTVTDEETGLDKDSVFSSILKRKYCYDPEGETFGKRARQYLTFPRVLLKEDFERLRQVDPEDRGSSQFRTAVGLDYVDFCPVYADYDRSHAIAVYGKREFGKTNLLNRMVDSILEQKPEARFVFFDDGRNQLNPIYNKVKERKTDCFLINQPETVTLPLTDGRSVTRSITPLQQFYLYLNEHYIDIDRKVLSDAYGLSSISPDIRFIPGTNRGESGPYTVFVIQSKLIYLASIECRYFIERVLPVLAAGAEEHGLLFIFSDVQKITDIEQNMYFNNVLTSAFLLDNIAEFAGERGIKTVFGSMDPKTLKEDYARCELGDGYYYDIEGDRLKKLKFIKQSED